MTIEELEQLLWAVKNKDNLNPYEKSKLAQVLCTVINDRKSLQEAFTEFREGMNH